MHENNYEALLLVLPRHQLALAIDAEGHGANGDRVAAALRRYDAARRWRLRFYQFNSRMLTPVFQSSLPLVGPLRDMFMGPLCHFPPTRLQMLTTLVGAQNNGWPYSSKG